MWHLWEIPPSCGDTCARTVHVCWVRQHFPLKHFSLLIYVSSTSSLCHHPPWKDFLWRHASLLKYRVGVHIPPHVSVMWFTSALVVKDVSWQAKHTGGYAQQRVVLPWGKLLPHPNLRCSRFAVTSQNKDNAVNMNWLIGHVESIK